METSAGGFKVGVKRSLGHVVESLFQKKTMLMEATFHYCHSLINCELAHGLYAKTHLPMLTPPVIRLAHSSSADASKTGVPLCTGRN